MARLDMKLTDSVKKSIEQQAAKENKTMTTYLIALHIKNVENRDMTFCEVINLLIEIEKRGDNDS